MKLSLPGGGEEYLLTDLPPKRFPLSDISKLYHMRWGIETSFRFLKYDLALDHFHCVKRSFIVQEIYARIVLYNFTMLIVSAVPLPQEKTSHSYKISITDAIATCRDFLIHRWINDAVITCLLRYLTPVKPDRSFPRKIHSKRFSSLNGRP